MTEEAQFWKKYMRCYFLVGSKRKKTAKKNHHRTLKMLDYAVKNYGGIPMMK